MIPHNLKELPILLILAKIYIQLFEFAGDWFLLRSSCVK